MRIILNHIILFLVALSALTSCALFKPKCPIPNCNIAKQHQHNLVFDRKAMKENKKLQKEKVEEFNKSQEEVVDEGLAEGVGEESDSSLVIEGDVQEKVIDGENQEVASKEVELEGTVKKKKKKKGKKKKKEDDETVDSEVAFDNSESEPKRKRKKKKSKNEVEDIETDADTREAMSAGNDTSAVDFNEAHNQLSKKEIREIEKGTKGEMSDSEKEAEKIENELKKKWRSRITAWFKKNQSPKIGEHWKGPVKKGNIPDYRVWPKVRIWPFTKEKDYTSY